MRKLALAFVAVAALAGAAGAGASSSGQAPITLKNGTQALETSDAGAIVGSADTSGWTRPTQFDSTGTTGAEDFNTTNSTITQGSVPGCKTAKEIAELDDITGLTVQFQYIVTSHWCWGSVWNIYDMHTGISWYLSDSTWGHIENCVGNDVNSCYGWFYYWHGNNYGGHYTFREGHVQQNVCIPFTGICFTNADCYPTVETWVNAGGGISARRETNCH